LTVLLIIFIAIPFAIGAIYGLVADMWDRPTKEQREINKQLWNERFHAGFIDSTLGVKIVSYHYHGSFGIAGIQKNDYITKVNGQDINSAYEAAEMMPDNHEIVTIEIEREGEIYEFDVYIKQFNKVNLIDHVGAKAIKQLTSFKHTDYILAYDTNILLKYPLLFTNYKNSNRLLVSKQVFKELDKQKTNEEIGHQARNAINMIEQLQKDGAELSFSSANDDYTKSKMLDPSSPDDRIIASYLYEAEKNNKKIFFISEDRGARIIAREAGLETIDWPA